jgi:hypothetical protein
MPKLTLTDIANFSNAAISTINANHAAVETAMEKTLSRDGTTPNTMEADLDMNSNQILNLPEPTTGSEPATKTYVDDTIEEALPSFILAGAEPNATLYNEGSLWVHIPVGDVYQLISGVWTDQNYNLKGPIGSIEGFVIGSDVQAWSANLDAWSLLATSSKLNSSSVSAFGLTLVDDADASTARTTLGLSSLATASTANGVEISGGNAQMTSNQRTREIVFVIDGGGAAITTGVKGFIPIDFNCTINQVTLLADQTGSIVIDVWKDTYANFPPTDADTITASAVPTISAATKSQNSTLTGWTTAITAGDILGFNVDSVTSITKATIVLKVTVT